MICELYECNHPLFYLVYICKMKIFLLLALPIFLIGCDKNPVPTENQTEYKFDVIIDGVANGAKGKLNDYDYWDFFQLEIPNVPMFWEGQRSTILQIRDFTHPNFIAGDTFDLVLDLDSNLLGEIPVIIQLLTYGDFYSNKYPALADPYNNYLVKDTFIDWLSYKSIKRNTVKSEGFTDKNALKLGTTLNITDTGTTPVFMDSLGNVKIGRTQNGYMNKTKLFAVEKHYIKDGKDMIKWSAPIELEFNFKAIRRW